MKSNCPKKHCQWRRGTLCIWVHCPFLLREKKQQYNTPHGKEAEDMAKMSEKAGRFVEEYLIDLNATQAAIRAGYSARSAGSIGCELLKRPAVRDAVQKAQAERSRRTGVNADRVLQELAKVSFVNPADVLDLSNGSVNTDAALDDLACIAGIKVKYYAGEIVERDVRLCDKVKALELCGRHLGMFIDKKELSAGEGNFEVKIKVVE